MNVKELKEILNRYPEDMEILSNISEGIGYKLNSSFEYKNYLILCCLRDDDSYFCKHTVTL